MTFPTDFSIPPAELGKAAEDAGFETLLFAEHTHIPVSRDTPNPRGGELPEKYWHTHDPFVALATVAQATDDGCGSAPASAWSSSATRSPPPRRSPRSTSSPAAASTSASAAAGTARR